MNEKKDIKAPADRNMAAEATRSNPPLSPPSIEGGKRIVTHRGATAARLAWNDTIEKTPGLGPQRIEFLKCEGFHTVGDLLLRAPLRFIDRRLAPPFKELVQLPSGEITAVGTVESVGEKGFGRKKRFICILTDGTGFLQGVWFNQYSYYKPELTPGRQVAFTGKVGLFDGPQMTHPKVTFLDKTPLPTGGAELAPVYPSGDEWEKIGLSKRAWPKLIAKVITMWDGTGPFIPEDVRGGWGLPTLQESIKWVHQPKESVQFDRGLEALKLAELYHHQLLMVLLRRRRKTGDGVKIEEPQIADCRLRIEEGKGSGAILRETQLGRFIAGLPFELSPGQAGAIDEMLKDLGSGHPMHRLLQGEVGAGKTIVALSAAAVLSEAGYQTAIMAPTEILARQHYATALKWCEPAGMKAVLVTGGRDPEENRRALFEAAVGTADIIIGTHALFQARVQMPRMALAVIDEQHRFGVRQRALLVGKAQSGKRKEEKEKGKGENGRHTGQVGLRPHVLLMSATPIPRTLALAHYGDLDLTYLAPPPGTERRVQTRVVNDSKRDKVFIWLKEELRNGKQGYLVFPVIDEGTAGLEAAEARFIPYSRIDFKGISTALVHGRMPIDQRVVAMDAFRKGDVKLLMATSVIEVGVDVADATLMVIENAERFGLSQLHQLRGRVGRSGRKGVCVLITPETEGDPGFERLRKLELTSDGLELAEEDLRLRGAGEPLGAKQTGWVKFKLADLTMDYKLLPRAHQAAEETLDKWPDLAPFPELRDKLRQEYRARPKTMMAG